MQRLGIGLLVCLMGGCASTTGDLPQPVEEGSGGAAAGGMAEGPMAELAERNDVADAHAPVPLPDDAEPEDEVDSMARLVDAVRDDPSDPRTHRRLGAALRAHGRQDEALQHFETAAELAPEDPSILLSLGIAYSAMGRFDDAERTYKRVLEVAPGYPKALNNLGNVALKRGDVTGAIDWYRRAVEADPDYLIAKHGLAGVLKYRGKYDEAYSIYEDILAMKPSNPREQIALVDSLYNMGYINLVWKKPELAEQQLARVTLADPTHRSAHYARAQALTQLGRMDEAQRELQMHLRVLHATGSGF